jgi:hypothetical protein
MGLNPGTVYWMDVSDASYNIKPENSENKGSRMGHTKKIFKKTMILLDKEKDKGYKREIHKQKDRHKQIENDNETET